MNAAADHALQRDAVRAGWSGELSLGYERRGGRTVLARRLHRGPLVVQKSLYPEGDALCQNIVVHPPAGIVGGDRLALDVSVRALAQAQLTTPGAAKWYPLRRRSGAAAAGIRDRIAGAPGVAAPGVDRLRRRDRRARHARRVPQRDAAFIGWDIVCLGRRHAGEEFRHGRMRQDVVILRDGARQWIERSLIAGGAAA